MKEIRIAAGCKTRIIRRQLSSMASTYTFNAAPIIENGYLAGTIEIKGSDWIFPKPSKKVPLEASNIVTVGVWETFFAVYIIPEVDVLITLPSESFGIWLWLIVLVAAVVVVIAITLILIT